MIISLHCLNLPFKKLSTHYLNKKKIKLSIKRDDLLHPVISGNKWRKLKYNLINMKSKGYDSFVTFGGAFSNHLYASAMACKTFNLTGHAIIRGPEIDESNPTIKMARACGMNLYAVNRKTYRSRHAPAYLQTLQTEFPNSFIIPEGGTNHAALRGVAELAASLPQSDYVICATGSGGTVAGLAKGCTHNTQVIGIAVLKQAEYLNQEIAQLLTSTHSGAPWQLLTNHHYGGYGKFTDDVWAFCQFMHQAYKLPLEPVYTGKMLFAVWQLISQDYFPQGSRITAIHTGGLQGLDGLRYRGLIAR
ncbi:1-aminocyclopropane-1-carboxylate deaminase/D-cysteine desulfhydrase [Pseudoalteromonas phenolica O-BC30]|nr:1-aminocyclopropane-1-carboxylate deaminase/D-cysteine desulfhydrase [Pseudoalteromonas phenolica O-BC30]